MAFEANGFKTAATTVISSLTSATTNVLRMLGTELRNTGLMANGINRSVLGELEPKMGTDHPEDVMYRNLGHTIGMAWQMSLGLNFVSGMGAPQPAGSTVVVTPNAGNFPLTKPIVVSPDEAIGRVHSLNSQSDFPEDYAGENQENTGGVPLAESPGERGRGWQGYAHKKCFMVTPE